METPIEVLRVEQAGISKELARFRACDPETRSLYCREWAQFIYKKHFIWNAKTQEEVPESQLTPASLTAGKYQINFILDKQQQDDQPVYKKERSALMSKKFENLVESWSSSQPDEPSLITQILEACQLWMTLPSGYSGLPNLFEPVEFNPYPDAIPLVDDPKDPSQLLDPLIIERQALCLPSDSFHLLKNLTGDILLSHTTPACNHTKPRSKTPADLEVDRAIFNEHEAKAVEKALKELTMALEQAWHPLNNFLDQLANFEKRRDQLMGKGCQATIDTFFTQQKYVSFVDIWTTEQSKFKNKKSTPEEIAKVDSLFEHHLNHLKSLVRSFMDDFVPVHLKEIHALTTDLWKMIVPTIYEMGERMAAHEDHKGNKNANATRIGESLKALDMESLRKMESSKEVDLAQKRIVDHLSAKTDEYMNDIDNLFKLYREASRPNLSGRVEKLNNKDFKKKIKKVESGYYSIRSTFRYEVTENIFPESLFCKFSLVCLEPLMQEGEVMEAVTIEKEVKRFVESHKDLLKQRCELLLDFEEGVQTGRRELAGVLGKLFLKEGMRIQGDNLALKRQNSLLKSMGVTPEEPKKKTKKKKSSAASSGASTPALIQEEPAKKSNATNGKKNDLVAIAAAAVEEKKEAEKAPIKKAAEAEPVKPMATSATASITASVTTSAPKPSTPSTSSSSKKHVVTEKNLEPATQVEKKIETPVSAVPDKAEKPASVIEKKVEKSAPAVTTKNSQKPVHIVTEKKKQEPTPVPTPKESPKNSTRSPTSIAVPEEVQGWDQLHASVPNTENNTTKKEDVVREAQDWETLRAEVLPQKDSTSVEVKNNDWNKPATAGAWSSVAARKPIDTNNSWSKVAATATTAVAPSSDVTTAANGWSSVASKDPVEGWANLPAAAATEPSVGTASSAWAPRQPVNNPTESTWANVSSTTNSKNSIAPAVTEVDDASLGSWRTSSKAVQESPTITSSNNAWPTAATGSWNTPVDKKNTWNNSSVSAEKKTPASWGVTSPVTSAATTANTDSDSPLGSWGKPAVGSWNSSKTSTKISSTNTWVAAPASTTVKKQSNGWNGAQLPWESESTNIDTSSQNTTTIQQPINKKAADASAPSDMAPTITSTTRSPPPGMTATSSSKAPPGLAAAIATKCEEPITPMNNPTSTASAPLGLAGLAPPPSLGASLVSTIPQLQDPLPSNLNELDAASLLVIIMNLHRENGTLIQSVYTMQQEMAMMSARYAEVMNLARERESQTLALFESRKQTEMEEARRYVLSLEARVKQMEEQLSGNSNATTAGFGNQDLFAGYREEMSTAGSPHQNTNASNNNNNHRSHHHHHHHNNHHGGRKLWQKNNTVVRCGNCGEVGHASAGCKSYCRYCGSLEHLSEACPMN